MKHISYDVNSFHCRASSTLPQDTLRTIQQQVEECNLSVQNMIKSLPPVQLCKPQRNRQKLSSNSATGRSRASTLRSNRVQDHLHAATAGATDILTMCSCFSRIAAANEKQTYIIGPLKFFYQSDAHCERCPLRRSAVTRRYGVTGKLRLSTGFNVTMLFESVSGGPTLQLAPQIIATRIVDPKCSPAFSALIRMGEELCKATGQCPTDDNWWLSTSSYQKVGSYTVECINNVRSAIDELHQRLELCLKTGLASGRDEDQHGSTLLHVSTTSIQILL